MIEHAGSRLRSARLVVLLTAGTALLLTLIGVSQPSAGAATQTKFYDVNLSGPSVGTGISTTLSVQVKNDQTSTQSFGSAEFNFGKLPTGTVSAVTATNDGGAAWTAQPVSGASAVYLFTSTNSTAIAPTHSLNITFTIDPSTAGSIPIATEVKQSNNFSGTGNDFINLTGDPSIHVYQSCNGSCTLNATSPLTGTKGTADINGPTTTPFLASAAFGARGDLSCDSQVTTTPGDPLVVMTPGTAASGTVSMTFPKSVVNNLANNGTPLMQVCAGASYAFATAGGGSALYVQQDGLYEGLLPDCPSGYSTINPELCVVSRSKNAANETIVIYVSNFEDPSFW